MIQSLKFQPSEPKSCINGFWEFLHFGLSQPNWLKFHAWVYTACLVIGYLKTQRVVERPNRRGCKHLPCILTRASLESRIKDYMINSEKCRREMKLIHVENLRLFKLRDKMLQLNINRVLWSYLLICWLRDNCVGIASASKRDVLETQDF